MHRRTLQTALIALLALLLVSAPVVAFTALGSIHTTAQDFQNGQLANFEAQNGEIQYKYTQIDDFEDGDLNIELSAWSGWSQTGSGSFFNQQNSINGTRSAVLNVDGGNETSAIATTNEDRTGDFAASVWVGAKRSSGSSDIEFWGDNNRLGTLEFNDTTSNIEWHINGNTYDIASSWSASTVYRPRFDWDFANNEVTISVAGSSSTVPTGSPDSYDEVRFRTSLGSGESERTFEFDDVAIDPGKSAQYVSANHSVSNAQTGFVNVTALQTANVTIEWQGWTGSAWTVVNSTTVSSAQNVSLAISGYDTWRVNVSADAQSITGSGESIATVADEGVLFEASAPQVDNSSANPDNTEIETQTTTFSINVSDADFPTVQDDTVTVEFFVNESADSSFNSIGTDTINTNTTASVSTDLSSGGEVKWYAVATDSYGGETQSATFNATVPSALYIRNESNHSDLVESPTTVTAQFIGEDQIYTRSTTNGTIDLTGLPVDQSFIVEVSTDGNVWTERTIRLESIFVQESVYLLNTSAYNTIDARFVLEDPTGQFSPETILRIQRPINISGTTTWQTIEADKFGVEGVTTTLESNIRYRIVIENQAGAVQVIGPYRSTNSETVTVRPGTPTIDIGEFKNGWAANAELDNRTLEYRYSDPNQTTDKLVVWIHERGNTSNQLVPNSTYYDVGNVSAQVSLTENESKKEWAVNFVRTVDGETDTYTQTVRNNPSLVPELSREWRLITGILMILLLGSIFSVLNRGVGAVVTAVTGGILWWLGWLSGATTGIIVGLTIFMAVLYAIYVDGAV